MATAQRAPPALEGWVWAGLVCVCVVVGGALKLCLGAKSPHSEGSAGGKEGEEVKAGKGTMTQSF